MRAHASHVPLGFVGRLLLGCLHLPCSRASALTRLNAVRVLARKFRCMCFGACGQARACLVPLVQVVEDGVFVCVD